MEVFSEGLITGVFISESTISDSIRLFNVISVDGHGLATMPGPCVQAI